jgi:hypothetical protein
LIDLLQVITGAQGEAIFTKLSQADVLAVDLVVVKFFDAIARERLPQSRRKIKHRAACVGYFNEALTQ